MRNPREVLIPIIIAFAVIVGLEMSLWAAQTPAYIFPRPSAVWQALISQAGTAATAWRVTMAEAMAGLALAVILSCMLALATVFLPMPMTRFINTIGVALQSTPLLAIAPLLSLWFGQSYWSKALASCIVCFFPLLTGWLSGLRSVDADRLHLFENLNATRWQTARYLLLPSALPFFFGGLRVAMPLALLGAIVAEFVGASEGLGFQILQNSYYVRTPAMIGYVVIASLSGMILTSIVAQIECRVLFWHGDQRSA